MTPGRTASVALAVASLVAFAVLGAGCGSVEFDGERAFSYVERQCEFGPRVPGTDGHQRTLAWLVDELGRSADQVSVQRFTAVRTDGREVGLSNVIASFRLDARERVLLGAHWDTREVADLDPDPAARSTPIPGANDGASGVAVLLTLAELMAARRPAVGVDIVLFDGEDGGRGGGFEEFSVGASYFAANMGDYAPSFAVIVDMVGDRDLRIPVEPNSSGASPDVVELVWDAAQEAGSTSFTRAMGTPVSDDHVPLIMAGVPSALVIDFDYAWWHTLEDTPDKCSPESLREVGAALVKLVY